MTDLIGNLEDQIDHGMSLDEIDREIEKLSMPIDEKDALSIYAWAWWETARGRKRGRRSQTHTTGVVVQET